MRSSLFQRFTRGLVVATLACAACAPIAASAVEDRVIVVLNSGDATISILDSISLKTLRTIDTGKEPHHLMETPDGKEVIIASSAGNSLMFLDSKSGNVQRSVRGIDDPYQLAFSPDRKWFAVT